MFNPEFVCFAVTRAAPLRYSYTRESQLAIDESSLDEALETAKAIMADNRWYVVAVGFHSGPYNAVIRAIKDPFLTLDYAAELSEVEPT